MSKIKILPEIIANQIAAGEIIERPASVVKELIENSLDAGSTRILVEVEKGGRALIRVGDNGIGMSRDDALLALERYATSKIYDDTDLFAISTLGFRGEALPSIASVTQFSLVTRETHTAEATAIRINGGKLIDVSAAGAPAGTMITAKNLFFNTPARRKYLKTIPTEMGHITDTVASIAMGWPEVQFQLNHNGKSVKHWPSTDASQSRATAILGSDVQDALIAVKTESDPVAITGFIASPQITRRTANGLYLYVNGRFIRDRMVRHAILQGYAGRLMKGQFPVAVLFITVPYDMVDINVHPTKHEVRFARPRMVHEAVVTSITQTLRQSLHPGSLENMPEEITPPAPTSSIGEYRSDYNENRINKEPREFQDKRDITSAISLENSDDASDTKEQPPLWKPKFFTDLRFIGELHNTYLLCESPDGLILVDQHAAHERIVFEQLKQKADASTPATQKLLIPETFDLNHREAAAFEKLIPSFLMLGLEIEPFGGTTFVVKSVPALLSGKELKPLLMEIASKVTSIGFSQGLALALDECLILIACHSSLRANQSVSYEQVKTLFHQMDTCDNPSFCPHGRPTWIKYSKDAVKKAFHR
ncbi:DNA mismatch repair endonuclease MutL [Desulfococcaceae bacterium HSG9]|nr:DNA mismatch repair endonuclease MutL [Desulfococcaceae bacterium HSG9]